MSSKIIYHKHHIVPKHMGGSDDPSNLVLLTIEEHAEAHKKLYEKHGKIQDYCAWLGLKGILNKKDIIKILQSEGAKSLAERRKKNKDHPFYNENNPSKIKVKNGNHHFQKNIGFRPGDIIQKELVKKGKHYFQTETHKIKTSINSKKRIANKTHKFSIKVSCPYCNKEGQEAAMKRWHFENCSFKPFSF